MFILSSNRLGASYMRDKFAGVLGSDLSDKRMLVVASAAKDDVKASLQAQDDAVSLGFDRDNISFFEYDLFVNLPALYTCLSFDYIYVVGGNTFKLLHTMRVSGFDKLIVDKLNQGATFIGYSAGAYLVSNDVRHIQKYDDNNVGIEDFSGMGLLNARLICHFDEDRYDDYCKLRMSTTDVVFRIGENDILVVDGNEFYYV